MSRHRQAWQGRGPVPGGAWVSSRMRALESLTIRAAVLLGFGVIFGLWLIAGFDSVRRLNEAERHISEINARFTRNEEQLFAVRSAVPMVAVYLRDAVLDTTLEDNEYYRDHLQRCRQQIDAAMEQYVPMIDSPAERETWAKLQAEIADYWKTALPVLKWDPERLESVGRRFLRRQVIPKRNLIIRISDHVQALNRIAFQQRKEELSQIYREMRRRIWWTGGISVLLGLAIALLVIWHAGRLETQIRWQHLQDQENRNDLRRLSAKLVRAQEEERRVIARELHDEIGQALTAIKMELMLAQRSLSPDGTGRSALSEARAIADRTVQTVRDLSQLLHPAMLDDLGLPDTLRWYLRGFNKRTGILTELVQEGMQERIAPEAEISAYRIIQEALNNVAKHAQASSCRINLKRLPVALRVTVEDDGKGFDPAVLRDRRRQRGLGLLGIQERVSELGGALQLESSIGKGTRLTVELPAISEVLEQIRCSAV